MIIEVKKLNYLFKKYGDEFRCFHHSDTVIDGKKYEAGTEIHQNQAFRMIDASIPEVEVQYNVTLYEYLSREFPVEYRKPVQWINSYDLEQLLTQLEYINSLSKRKRFLHIIGDIFSNRGEIRPGQREILFRHGEKLYFQKWRNYRVQIDMKQKFFLRNSENGIIIFGNVKSEEHDPEDDDHWKKLNLLGAMLSYKFDKKFEISPDFIPNKDLHKVRSPKKLLEEYIRKDAKLIIFNDELTREQKEALLQVKKYDPFVRMMVLPLMSQFNIEDILVQLKLVYNTDFWKKSAWNLNKQSLK